MRFGSVLLTAVLLAGCSSPFLYGNKSCAETGEVAFLSLAQTGDRPSVVCLPAKTAVFIYCARELGLTSATSEANSTLDAQLKLKVLEAVDANPALKLEVGRKIGLGFGGNDQLNAARADALAFCKNLADAK